MKARLFSLTFVIMYSCSPFSIVLNNTNLPTIYFQREINRLEKKKTSFINNRKIIKSKVEFAYGIILEKSDRIIEDNYMDSQEQSRKAQRLFLETKQLCFENLGVSKANSDDWWGYLKKSNLTKENIYELYYLSASIGGLIKTSKGDPKEIINFPQIGILLRKAINLEPNWNNGSLQSAMTNYTASRMDIDKSIMKDSINFYFDKTLDYSESLDASAFVAYAELVYKPDQNKEDFISILEKAISIKTQKGSNFKLSNIIAQNRANWLLSNVEDYFIE